MRGLILLLATVLASILIGCQSVQDNRITVHLHPGGEESSTVNFIQNLLEAEGYRVVIRSNVSPYRGHGVTLIYGGGLLDQMEVYRIDSLLEESGYAVANIFRREAQNHRYTARNLGLYLDEGDGETELPLEPLSVSDVEFASVDCTENFTAHFERDGTVVFFSGEGSVMETTSWRLLNDNRLQVMGGQRNRFEILASNRLQDDGILKRTLSLLPQGYYRAPYGCSYSGSFYEARRR